MSQCSDVVIETHGNYVLGKFSAMASPCEVIVDTMDQILARSLTLLACEEAKRIEQKFSRYRDDNIVYQINHSDGKAINVDEETARMLNYAATLYELSDGLFDITSGVLRRVWRFDGSDNVPSAAEVSSILPLVGWKKVHWESPQICLPKGMEIDLGGIGKEYAVDRTAQLLRARTELSFLINYGGDLYAAGPRKSGEGWVVGLDDPANTGAASLGNFELKRGGIATSGDARRFLSRDGVRYSHILDPRSGWPVKNAPRGVTVATSSCTEAGMLATFAMLHGAEARQFLQAQQVQFWCY